ncbi:MAG: hypothetical protein Q4E35_05775 [Eubacteriales bacterium]|nr:hypothetical protein [Eubacteriales bacterium]
MEFEGKEALSLDELENVSGGQITTPTYLGKKCRKITLKSGETPMNVAMMHGVDIMLFKRLNPGVDIKKPMSGFVYIPED